jgi:hypothetical protein
MWADHPRTKLTKAFPTRFLPTLRVWAKILWAGPNSLIGLSVGFVGMLLGGKVARYGRVLEFWGGLLKILLPFFPPLRGSSAITLGHVILYKSAEAREALRAHELVHVEQYEKWGVFFIPAYLASSIFAFFRGEDPYLGNHFEQKAFARSRCPSLQE